MVRLRTLCPILPLKSIWTVPTLLRYGWYRHGKMFVAVVTTIMNVGRTDLESQLTEGGGYARTGQAYSQFNVWTLNQTFELLGVELISELEGGKRYHVEFYLSMQDSLWYASKNVGVYFSVEQPVNNVDSIESYQPQVRYEGDFITDKEGWTLVAGSFVAKGGEQFITIGNFDTYEETEILFVPGGGVPPSHSATFWEAAGYFIDDVSVIPDSITSVHEVLNVERSYKHYPNPNTGAFTVEMKLLEGEVAQLLVWNVSGQQVHSQMLNNGINALEMDAAKGLYLYGITVNGATQWNGKIVVTSE